MSKSDTSADEQLFEAIWQTIKDWDIERAPGDGRAGATGTDVKAIIRAVASYTKQRELALLERLFDDEKMYFDGGRLNYIVPKSAIQKEKEKLL